MTKTVMHQRSNPKDIAAVVEQSRRRLRLLLIAVLVALAGTAAAMATHATSPHTVEHSAEVCLAHGPGATNNGKAVIAAGLTMDVPQDGIVAALTAAMQETNLLNLANPNVPASLTLANDGLAVDHQAVGILLQTATWGSPSDRMSPATAAGNFFTAMNTIDGWHAMSPADLAGLVQRSALPDSYVDDVAAARQFYHDHVGEVRVDSCTTSDTGTGSAPVGAHS